MKKNAHKYIKAVIIPPIIFLIALYFFFAWYYKDTFSYGTWINGVYCTGKTISDINNELISQTQMDSIELLMRNGEKEVISLEKIDYAIDFTEILVELKQKQNSYFWIQNIFNSDGIHIQPNCSYSKDKLLECLKEMSFYKSQMDIKERSIKIELTLKGYELVDTRSDILDFDLVEEEIDRSLISLKSSVNLYDTEIYYEVPMTMEDLELLALWEKVEAAQEFNSKFIFGEEEEVIDASVVSKWIAVDEQGDFLLDETGNLVIDEACIVEYVNSLSEKYNTYIFPREYMTHDGRIVSISKGNYGNLFDVDAECEYLKNAYYSNLEEDHVPTYIKSALYQEEDDIGKDYIEIDLTNQKLYAIFDDVLTYETDIVTGNVSAGMGTTDRICYIYSKQTNRILRGPGYASHVDYWMPVSGGIGIHDAKWRSTFGGTIYQKNGSHGCINVPKEIMPDIFEQSYVGMPVIIYY